MKKENNNKKKPWKLAIEGAVLVILILLAAGEIRGFYLGFNSVDNNFNYQNNLLGACNPDAPSVFEVNDVGNDGVSRPLVRYYIGGMNQMEEAFMLNMLLALLLGILIREII